MTMERELVLSSGRRDANQINGAPFPPVPDVRLSDGQPRPRYDVPGAQTVYELREPSPPAEAARAGDPDPQGNPNPVTFHEYDPSGSLEKDLTNAADMSGADSERDVVMMSFNWRCDVSADGGASWSRQNPTTIFPALGNGFCCDQVITFVPEFDLFVWFLQYKPDAAGQGAFRIAVATSQSVANDPTAWTYWDFVAGDFGFATNDMDYPDLAFSARYLYASTDVMGTGGRLVLRILLQELAAGGTIGFDYTDPANSTTAWGGHLVQQTRSQAVWVGQRDNSTLQMFTMPDAGSTYGWFDVTVATWPNGTHSSMGPDGNDWLTKLDNFPTFAVTGGVERRDNGHVMIAWSASKGKGTSGGFDFPNTHVRVVELDLGNRNVVSEMQVWNPDYAFAYPALAVNAADEVGIILGWGGPNNHANCAMGIIGDFVVWFRDDSTRTVQRFGDYLTTRRAERNHDLFAGFGYYVTEVAGQPTRCTYNPIYVRYGRS
ncbi:MAG: hypothetical protein ACJ789_16930 [Thermomicrobiales bacterium]